MPDLLSSVAAVSFDVGGTLIEPWPSVGAVYARVARQCGAGPVDPAALDARFAAVWRARSPDFPYTRKAWAELVSAVFDGLDPIGRSPEFFDRLYAHFATAIPWRIFPEVRAVLAALRERGLRLAVVSNWDERLPGLLRSLGLAGAFDVTVVSGELGCHKPAPAIFAEAASRLDVPPIRLLHVGDDPVADVQGARQAGLRAVWLRRGKTPAAPDEIADLTGLLSTQ